MKKIFTVLLGLTFWVTGFSAAKVATKVSDFHLDPQRVASLIQKEQAAALAGKKAETLYTRNWVDASGSEWSLELTYSGLTILDALNEEAQAAWKDELLYLANLQLVKFNQSGNVSDGVVLYVCWPSVYWYDQIYSYTGELDANNMIPVDKRDLSIAAPSDVLNNASRCRIFEETGAILDMDASGVTYWGILPLSAGYGQAILNGAEATSASTESNPATFDFKSYDLEEGSMNVRFNIPLQAGTTTRTLSGTYNGIAEVEGFEPRYVTTQQMTGIHLFNGGKISEEILGDESPFTDIFEGELTQFYLLAFPEQAQFMMGDAAKAFNPNDIGIGFAQSVAENDINCYQGYLFADVKYAEDTTLDPSDMTFNLKEPEWIIDELLDEGFWGQAPAANTFVSYRLGYEWSSIYGMRVANLGFYQQLVAPSTIQWGTNQGFVATMENPYFRYITSKGTPDIIYHYDPTDMTKTRTFTSVGTREPSAVKGVSVDSDVKVIARDGMINVVAGENAPIAIFTLDGKLVKATKASEVSVEAPKGMYVVRVGNKAKKVVL